MTSSLWPEVAFLLLPLFCSTGLWGHIGETESSMQPTDNIKHTVDTYNMFLNVLTWNEMELNWRKKDT